MARFDLKKAKQQAEANAPLASGYYRAAIVQVTEVGWHPGFNAGDEPVEKIGIVFELASGAMVAKLGKLSLHSMSILGSVIAVIDRDVDELKELLGAQLDLEIEESGKYPKVIGYYSVDDGMADADEVIPKAPQLYYTVDEPDPEAMKKLHRDLRAAISSRLREKGNE